LIDCCSAHRVEPKDGLTFEKKSMVTQADSFYASSTNFQERGIKDQLVRGNYVEDRLQTSSI
jgi:hypothetical protein